MKEFFKKHGLSACLITLALSLVYYFLHNLRFADPDQYFHLAVSRHLASTWDFFHLPQVKGMGWDEAFSDKEFLFHLVTAMAYKFFGEQGVFFSSFLCALSILFFVYTITYHITRKVWVSVACALFPLFLETYILKLMVVRAFLPAVALVLGMIYALISERKKMVLLMGVLFSLTYHALPVPALVLAIWLCAQWVLGKKKLVYLSLWGFLGLVIGLIINPYFPANMSLMVTSLRVALDQFQPNGLEFGPEQIPYRTDNFLKLFRFIFLFLAMGLGILWLKFQESMFFKKMPQKFNDSYFFISVLSFVLFCLMFLSPRVQEYAIPIICIYAGLSLSYLKYEKQVLGALLALMLIFQLMARPFQNLSQEVLQFQKFDGSYFSLVKDLPQNEYVFNCEWWGGHYIMMSRPDLKTVDVLDPTLLRSASNQVFELVTSVRQGRMLDPYHFLKDILKTNYILCSAKTPLNEQLLKDPRFQKLAQTTNSLGDVFLYRLRPPEQVGAVIEFEVLNTSKEWVRLSRQDTDPSLVYVTAPRGSSCLDLKVSEGEFKKLSGYSTFALSGDGVVSVFKDNAPYLKASNLPQQNSWGELLLPLDAKAKEWRFEVCPDNLGRLSLGVFLLNAHQEKLYCGQFSEIKKQNDVFEKQEDRCQASRVR